ncbi:MAG TPA: ATP-binding protein, partial [Rugosimonospora sp.]|nr:ATP-binding protein [Rugosimonospora sp.]
MTSGPSQRPGGDIAPLGRERELERWARALAASATGLPALIEVVGAPGIGKSRLLQEFALTARAKGMNVLVGSQYPAGAPNPLPVRWAAEPEYTGIEELDARLRETLRDGRTALGGPVLLLEDLHQAEAELLALLARLLSVPPDGLVVAVAYRPRQADQAVAAALSSATGLRHEVLHLQGLVTEDIARLLGIAPGPLADTVARLSGGNPLYAGAYRTMARSHRPPAGDELPDELPVDVARALLVELSGLTSEERTV